jgi:hypothetical protein
VGEQARKIIDAAPDEHRLMHAVQSLLEVPFPL